MINRWGTKRSVNNDYIPLVEGLVLMYLCSNSFQSNASFSGTTPRTTATPLLCKPSLNLVLCATSFKSQKLISGTMVDPRALISCLCC